MKAQSAAHLARDGAIPRRTPGPATAATILALWATWLLPGCDTSQKAESLVTDAAEALEQRDFARAEELALAALKYDSQTPIALKIAGDAAAEQNEFDRALQYYARIPETDRIVRCQGCNGAARVLVIGKSQLSEAEAKFREALSLQPNDYQSLDGLSFLLAMTGRRWESAPFYLRLLQTGRCQAGHLLGIGVLEYQLSEPYRLRACLTAAPTDPLPALGLARLALHQNDHVEALRLLRTAVRLAPGLSEAQARLGHMLLDQGDFEGLVTWHAQLPAEADEHPEIWVVRGRWAQHTGDSRGAVRCYLEALRRDPNHQLAASQISVVLFALGETALAQQFTRRSQQLLRYHEVIFQLRKQPDNAVRIAQAAQRAETQDRLWEAQGWYEQLSALGVDQQRVTTRLRAIKSRLTPTTPQMLPENNPALHVALDSWPLPQLLAAPQAEEVRLGPAPLHVPVRFTDLAQAAGLDFRYVNGRDPRKPGFRMFEVDGGGVGILDYDGDGWPDIYLTQGCRWPPDPEQTEFYDRLYRNLGDGRFEDVTLQAGLRENGFGQGLSVGDIDNDGYPDLYIGNFGPNRLYHNRGDGTFEDITAQSGLTGSVWTSSCVIVDLNGDTYPDIYEVNYLKDEEKMFDRLCPDSKGKPRICPPIVFDAEQHRLYVNHGDGTFHECGEEAGIHVGDGKGLGIVAADFDDSGKISLFVANDVVENFYFYNETPAPGEPIKLVEQALVRGLAFAADGQAQASMGVATDDINYDLLLDMLVANFYLEPNCLYVQQPDHTFVDVTRSTNLYDASFPMLGFGTQFLDGESDGLPDVVVANGHLMDETDLGIPYQMRPQYFRNEGSTQFVELRADVLGEFFDRPQLGRGLATLDWNRDGLEDFAITYLDRPAALVTNQTPRAGHFLAVSLYATDSARDAIGTKVTVEFGGHVRRRQLIGGNGYQVSCQRQLLFGLGRTSRVDRLHVLWPSGREQTWTDLEVDVEVRIVEGRDTLERVPR